MCTSQEHFIIQAYLQGEQLPCPKMSKLMVCSLSCLIAWVFRQSTACLSCIRAPGIVETPVVVYLRVVAYLQVLVACPVVIAVMAVGVGVAAVGLGVDVVVGKPPLHPFPSAWPPPSWMEPVVSCDRVPLMWSLVP